MTAMNSKTEYRPEVDGLRAIAVMGVIIYHASSSLLPGGFIGVDVFFVISGYLITRLILSELIETGKFSFAHFYERRARRIFPMLLTVILVSLPVAAVVLAAAPGRMIDYLRSLIWAIGFGSNFHFYFASTEYGAAQSLLEPFLHTWSLGVEEQFYILFPVIMLFVNAYIREHRLAILVGLFLLSLQFAEFASTRDRDLNFYLPMSRFWELLTGSIIAHIELTQGRLRHSVMNAAMPVIGLYMIAWSILSLNDATPHPSFATLVPVAGTALIILFSSQDDFTGKLLGSRPFVSVGLVSYSAYLWHFPIFAFARAITSEPSMLVKLALIGLTLALSAVSYFVIERPFRRRSVVGVRRLIVTALSASAFVGVSAMAMYPNLGDFELRARSEPQLVLDQTAYLKVWTKFKGELGPTSLEPDPGRTQVLIVGDSHATDLYSALKQNNDRFPEFNFAITHSDRPMPRESHYEVYCLWWEFLSDGSENCENTHFSLAAKYSRAQIVVLATHWIPEDIKVLDQIIDRLKSDGKEVVLVSNNLEIRDQVLPIRRFILDNYRFPNDAERDALERETYQFLSTDERVIAINRDLKIAAAKHGVKYLVKHDIFCSQNERRCRMFTPDNDILHWDYAHFTVSGARYLGGRIADLNWLQLKVEKGASLDSIATSSGIRSVAGAAD